MDCVEYYHIWLGKHEIIKSNGAYTESFFPGAMALNALAQSQRLALAKTLSGNYALARPHLRGKRLRDLLALYRHQTKPPNQLAALNKRKPLIHDRSGVKFWPVWRMTYIIPSRCAFFARQFTGTADRFCFLACFLH